MRRVQLAEREGVSHPAVSKHLNVNSEEKSPCRNPGVFAARALFRYAPNTMKATGTYTVKKWKEDTLQLLSPNTKTTKATVEYAFVGDIQGTGTMEYLMFYHRFDDKDPHAATASYLGQMVFAGTIKGQEGTFVLEDHGTFEAGGAMSKLKVIEGSGTGALEKIKGTGGYHADKSGFKIELDCEF